MSKVKITGIPDKPHMQQGGVFNSFPYSGDVTRASIVINPFGLITSDTTNLDKNISDSLKPVDREKANAEYEKGETVLKFDLGGIYRVLGKPHSQGGTPVMADGGDFVFSNDKDLALTKDDKENFNLKTTGTVAKKENTPSKILNKEVDTKHYNKMMSIMNDPTSTSIAKSTAQLMLQKYLQKAGQIAYIQESKKGFPQGLPSFSENTAPVEDPSMTDAKDKERMYARYGGNVPKFQPGGNFTDLNAYTKSILNSGNSPAQEYLKGLFGQISQNQQTKEAAIPKKQVRVSSSPNNMTGDIFSSSWMNDAYNSPGELNFSPSVASAMRTGQTPIYYPEPQHKRDAGTYGVKDWDVNEFRNRQSPYFADKPNWNPNNPKDVLDFQNWYNTQAQQRGYSPYFQGSGSKSADSKFGEYTYNAPGFRDIAPGELERVQNSPMTLPNAPQSLPNGRQGQGQIAQNYNSNVPVTPFQGFNVGMNGMEAASIAMPFLSAFVQPTYYDMLQQKHTPNIRLDRVSNQQELNDIGQQGALATREMYANMPGAQASANAANTMAKVIQARGQSNAGVRNANTQIANQEAMTNYNSGIRDQDFNLGNIHQTYNNNVRAQQARNEQLANAGAQSFNNASAIQRNLDSLNQSMTSAVLPYLTNAYYDNKGNLVGQGSYSDLTPDQRRRVASAKQVAPIGFNGRTRLPYATGFGSLNSVPNANNQELQQMQQQAFKTIFNSGDPRAIAYALRDLTNLYKPNSKGQSPYEEMMQNMYGQYYGR